MIPGNRSWEDNIFDIINAIEYIEEFIQDVTFDEFIKDKKTNFAVIRSLDIIGKASKNIPDTVREEYPGIPWKDMAGMIEKIIHQNFGIDFKKVWEIITEDIPSIELELRKTLNNIAK